MGQQDPPLKRRGLPRGDRAQRCDRAGGKGGGDGKKGYGWRDPKEGGRIGDPRWGGIDPREENTDLPDFTPELAHLLLLEVYRDFPHHNNGSHPYGGVTENILWPRCWRQLAAKSASWYATPTGAVGSRFTAILAVEWQGATDRSWNSGRPLFFAHIVLTKTLGIRRAQEIRVRITRRMDLWDRGLHTGLVGYAEAEGAAREGRDSNFGEYKDEALYWTYHDTVFSGKIRQAVRWATDREGGGGVSSRMTNALKSGDRLQRSSGRSTWTCGSPTWKIPRAQHSRSMGKCSKWYPSTSRRMT